MTTFEFYRKTPYNKETLQQLWTTIINDTHDCHCGCTVPFVHLLDILFPPDHKDRHLTIDSIIKREKKYIRCLFGGKEEEDSGGVAEEIPTEKDTPQEEIKEEDDTEENIRELLAAADAAEKR